MSRKKTPDIMGTLLGQVARPTAPPAPAPSEEKPETPPAPTWDEAARRTKATFNLSEEVLRALERLWMRLRVEEGLPCSKSELVEVALQLALEDSQTRGQDSDLVRRLSGNYRRA